MQLHTPASLTVLTQPPFPLSQVARVAMAQVRVLSLRCAVSPVETCGGEVINAAASSLAHSVARD